MKLHLCVICGRDNRFNYIQHTVEHSLPVFDAVHLMDTGSTDGTSRLAAKSTRINYFDWDRWEHGWGDAYDCVRRDVPNGDWFLYLDSDELPSQYLLDHIRTSVARIEKEGYGQARIPNVLHIDGQRHSDPVERLPRTPEEFEQCGCWTKPIICRNGPELKAESFGMHAQYVHRHRSTAYLPLYYCHHKHPAQIDSSIAMRSFVRPEAYDIPIGSREYNTLSRLRSRCEGSDPAGLVKLLRTDPPADFIDLIASWKDHAIAACRHWYAWCCNGFEVGGYSLSLCAGTCCRYSRTMASDAPSEPGSIPSLSGDWSLQTQGQEFFLVSRQHGKRMACNAPAAALLSEVDGSRDLAGIVNNLAENYPESTTEICEQSASLLESLRATGVISVTTTSNILNSEVQRAIDQAVAGETAYWRQRRGWDPGAPRRRAEQQGWILATFHNGTVSIEWHDHATGRCRVLGPYLQRIAMETGDIEGEFVVNPDDALVGHPDYPVLGFSKLPENVTGVLIPDLYFMTGYGNLRENIEDASARVHWAEKIQRAVWRGVPTGQANDQDNWRDNLRVRLCLYSISNPRVVDACLSNFAQCTDAAVAGMKSASLALEGTGETTQMMYRYLLNVDGNSASWSGTFWKLLSNCLTIQIEPERSGGGYRQWYHYWLEKDRHYLRCRLDGLADCLRWAREHDDECRVIAANATAFVHSHLSDEAGRTYTARLLSTLGRINRRS